MDNIKRFDLDKKPVREKFFLTPIAWLLSFPAVWSRKLKVTKVNMDSLKPPYILLATHHSFLDFKVTTAAIFPRRANYIVAIDGFIGREWILRNAGGICKRKFTNDLKLFKQIKYALEKLKNIVAIYPEARYSLCGTTAMLPDSLAKMIKVLKHPVAMLNMHGNYLTQPVWNLDMRKVPLAADLTQIITKEEIEKLNLDEINSRIKAAFEYDEYKWQKDNLIKIDFKDRAKNLHKVLYQCPSCLTEHEMDSDLNMIWCNHCHKTYEMDVYGSLHATAGVTEFPHIPDWYEFEREQVKKQILAGKYFFEDEVSIESLPNAKGYIPLGKGKLTHGMNGFVLLGDELGKPLHLEKEPLAMYSLHIEYDYMKKGDCVDLSTLNDTYYIYPLNRKNVVTKLHFATEELYKLDKAKLTESNQKTTE